MDNNNNSYADLYGGENPKGDVIPPGVLPPEAEEVIYTYDPQLIKKGMIKTRVIGVILTAPAVVAFLAMLMLSFTTSGSVETVIALLLLIPIALYMVMTVTYMLGSNVSRIILGVLAAVDFGLQVLGFLGALIVTAGNAHNGVSSYIAVELIVTAVSFVPLWFTLIDKSVRAYFNSNK